MPRLPCSRLLGATFIGLLIVGGSLGRIAIAEEEQKKPAKARREVEAATSPAPEGTPKSKPKSKQTQPETKTENEKRAAEKVKSSDRESAAKAEKSGKEKESGKKTASESDDSPVPKSSSGQGKVSSGKKRSGASKSKSKGTKTSAKSATKKGATQSSKAKSSQGSRKSSKSETTKSSASSKKTRSKAEAGSSSSKTKKESTKDESEEAVDSSNKSGEIEIRRASTPEPKKAETPNPKRIEKAEPVETSESNRRSNSGPAVQATPGPGSLMSAGALPADITIEKSGLQEEQRLEPPPPPPVKRGFWPWSRGPANYRYLTSANIAAIRNARVQSGRWKFIIVHNSGTRQGNARAFDYYHRKVRRMRNGLAYHFVIGNGTSSGNGQIEIGDRWRQQLAGGHVHSDYMNNIGLGICLVGDFNRDQPTRAQLEACEELIRYLRERCGRSDGRALMVRPHREVNPPRWSTDCPGDAFPYPWLGKFR